VLFRDVRRSSSLSQWSTLVHICYYCCRPNCCKGNKRMAKSGVSELQNPWTYWHKIWINELLSLLLHDFWVFLWPKIFPYLPIPNHRTDLKYFLIYIGRQCLVTAFLDQYNCKMFPFSPFYPEATPKKRKCHFKLSSQNIETCISSKLLRRSVNIHRTRL